ESAPIHHLTVWQRPVFLLNSRLSLITATLSGFKRVVLHPTRAPLLPKLRGYFAEFLRESCLAHLGILYLTTCVGLGYGHQPLSLRRFSRQHGIYEVDSVEPSLLGLTS